MRRRLLGLGTAVLGLLAGCDVGTDTAVAMRYGVFDTDWDTEGAWCELSGQVTDADGENWLPDIQVSTEGMVDRTNSQGGFTMSANGPCPEPTILVAADVDGPDGGSWAEAEVEIEIDRSGDVQGNWGIHIQMEPAE